MMQQRIYFTVFVAAVAGLWLVWDLGLKKLFLYAFRERLFEIRFRLFTLGMNESLSFNGDAYRSVETLINGLIRNAHRITFLTFLFAVWLGREDQKHEEHIDVSQELALKISRLPKKQQEELRQILSDVQRSMMTYMGVSSIAFQLLGVIAATLRAIESTLQIRQAMIVSVFESEAYRAERRRQARFRMRQAAAAS